MLTVPLVGWVAKLGPNRALLPSFSVHKYGAQCSVDYWDADAGDGLLPDCRTPVVGNNPNDAYAWASVGTQAVWIQHLLATWKSAAMGGVAWVCDGQRSNPLVQHASRCPPDRHARDRIPGQGDRRRRDGPRGRPDGQDRRAGRVGLERLPVQRVRPAIRRRPRLGRAARAPGRAVRHGLRPVAADAVEGEPRGRCRERAFLPAGRRVQRRRLRPRRSCCATARPANSGTRTTSPRAGSGSRCTSSRG